MGYLKETIGYCFYHRINKKLFVSKHAIFLEKEFVLENFLFCLDIIFLYQFLYINTNFFFIQSYSPFDIVVAVVFQSIFLLEIY